MYFRIDLHFPAGHYQQASEKAWLAVDQALKKLALAKDKPIKYLKKHVRKREFADFLGEIDSDIPWLFAMAEQLHDNFYDGTLQSEMITLRFEQIEKKLFGKLDKFEKDGEVTLNDFFDKYPQK
jgi:hypothetical protein